LPRKWFRHLKERCVWRHEFETLDQAREVIAAYIDHYHHPPDSRLNSRTPSEVRQTWDGAEHYKNTRPEPSTPTGNAPSPPRETDPSRSRESDYGIRTVESRLKGFRLVPMETLPIESNVAVILPFVT
jgi:Integrase core domain